MESLQKKSATGWDQAEEMLRDLYGKDLSIKRVDEYTGLGRVRRVDDSLEFGHAFEGAGCLLFRLNEN